MTQPPVGGDVLDEVEHLIAGLVAENEALRTAHAQNVERLMGVLVMLRAARKAQQPQPPAQDWGDSDG